ncbi:MAG: hypothetical protein ABEI86_01065 [Halobacteriaceae archaeon]
MNPSDEQRKLIETVAEASDTDVDAFRRTVEEIVEQADDAEDVITILDELYESCEE